MAGTVFLFGDSVLDNDGYVVPGPGVTDQLRARLGADWSVAKHAVDGDVTTDVPGQVERAGRGATHAVLSVGGNDLLRAVSLLSDVRSEADVARVLMPFEPIFEAQYEAALRAVGATAARAAACTIYDAIPFTDDRMRRFGPVGIGVANNVIRQVAERNGATVLDLAATLQDADDFAAVSPIEPSERGGEKIADLIVGFCGQEGPNA